MRPSAAWRRLVVIALASLACASAVAQEELNDDREVLERKEPAQAMTETVYRRLATVHKLLGDDRYQEALADLEKLARMSLNNYEKALVYQTFGFVYVQLDRNDEALQSFETSLSLNSLPGEVTQGMLYSLAGLYAAEGQYRKAIDTMREWFRYEPEPKAEAWMVIASAYAELEEFANGLPYVRKAIEKSAEPRDNWYMLEVAMHVELKQFREAGAVLRRMLQLWPDVARYWDLLSGVYLELGEDKNALDAMMVAYSMGYLQDQQKLVSLAQLNLLLDIPYTAGQVLDKGMQAGIVEASQSNLDMLLVAWTNAKEYERAIATLDRLAQISADGKYYMQKAGIYNDLGDWDQAVAAAKQAVQAGVEDPTDAYMLAGTALTEMGRYREAIDQFESARASGDAEERANARSWIAFVQEKIQLGEAALN